MDRLLPKSYLEFNSFLAGAIIIAVLVVLYFVFRKKIKSIFGRASSGLIDFRNSLTISSDSDYIKIVYRYAQSLHVASDYYPLEGVLVPSKCIAPPPAIQPEVKALDPSLIQQSFGYDPALPELLSEFFGPNFTLLEALSGNTNLCLIGFPGSGKTTAIAECIINLAKGGDPDSEISLEYSKDFEMICMKLKSKVYWSNKNQVDSWWIILKGRIKSIYNISPTYYSDYLII